MQESVIYCLPAINLITRGLRFIIQAYKIYVVSPRELSKQTLEHYSWRSLSEILDKDKKRFLGHIDFKQLRDNLHALRLRG